MKIYLSIVLIILLGACKKDNQLTQPKSAPAACILATSDTVFINQNLELYNCAHQSGTYVWSYGDGAPNDSGGSVNHIYTTAGVYDLTLTAKYTGYTSTSKTIKIYVMDQVPSSIGYWDFKGIRYYASSCLREGQAVYSTNNTISLNNNSLQVAFYDSLPTTSGIYSVVSYMTGPGQVAITEFNMNANNHNTQFESTDANGQVNVIVANGHTTVSGNGIILGSYNNSSDTALITFNVTSTN